MGVIGLTENDGKLTFSFATNILKFNKQMSSQCSFLAQNVLNFSPNSSHVTKL
jgi:hypothetical protein